MKAAIFFLSGLLSQLAHGETKAYRFDTSDYGINSRQCLQDLRPHGRVSQWACVNGKLQSLVAGSGLKLTAPFYDLNVSFDIVNMFPEHRNGKGETVIWLRNGSENGVMRRIRVVIEQNQVGSIVRIEESHQYGGGYQRLAEMNCGRYLGRYSLSVSDSEVSVSKGSNTVYASTSVFTPGGFYLFSSGGEGAVSGYDNLVLSNQDSWNIR